MLATLARDSGLQPIPLDSSTVAIGGKPFVVVKNPSPGRVSSLVAAGHSVLAYGHLSARVSGMADGRRVLALPLRPPSLRPSHRRGPAPYVMFALVRLAVQGVTASQSELARRLGVTQPAVSQAARRCPIDGRGDRGKLFDWFLANYPGAGGLTSYWWSMDPVPDQAAQVRGKLISGDLAADRLAPWRIPERATVYAETGSDLSRLGFAEAGPDRYTLSVTVPADWTLFRTANDGLADPCVTAWDVQHTGTTGDQGDAVAKIRELVSA